MTEGGGGLQHGQMGLQGARFGRTVNLFNVWKIEKHV